MLNNPHTHPTISAEWGTAHIFSSGWGTIDNICREGPNPWGYSMGATKLHVDIRVEVAQCMKLHDELR